MTTKNHLSHAESYKLTRFIDENQEDLRRYKNLKDVAKKAQSELGFQVSDNNALCSCKMLGIDLGGMRPDTTTGHSKDTTRELARCLVDLAESLGHHVPPAVRAAARRIR